MDLKRTASLILCLSMIGFTGCSINSNKKMVSTKEKKIPKSLAVLQNNNTDEGKKPKDLILSMNQASTLNPIANNDKSVEDIFKLAYSGLIDLDDYLQPKPAIAQSWSFSNDGTSLTLNLNQNAKWSDGKSITADDVVYTLDKILAYSTHSPYEKLLSEVKFYTADGNSTVTIELKKKDYSFVSKLFFPILQKDFYERHKSRKFAVYPSSGKYIFESYNGEKTSRLKINNYYFGKKPNIKNILVYIMPDNSVKFDMFEERQLDAINTSVDFLASSESITSNERKYSTDELIMLGFNFRNKYLKDINVRKAIAYSINRNEIVDKVLLSKAIVTDSVAIPGSWLNKDTKKKLAYSAESAQSIFKRKKGIASAGLRIITTNNSVLKNIALEVKNSLTKLGVGCYIESLDSETYLNKLDKKDFDICLIDEKVGFNNDVSNILGHNNFLSYNSKKMADALNQLQNTDDNNKIKDAFSKIDNLYIEDVPCLTLLFRAQDLYIDNRIKGNLTPNMFNPYNNISSWHLNTK